MAKERTHDSYLFTIRFWPDRKVNGQVEWRGKVLGVTSGDSLYFRDWQMLLTFLHTQLQGQISVDQPAARGSGNPRGDG